MNQNASQPTTSSTRSSNFIPLEAIRVASPCKASWNKMDGDTQARFCGSCVKHVYNLSAMTRAEAEALVAEKEGKLCVRFYQREDGTMLTSDCNIGAAALSMKLREARFSPLRVLALVACAVGALLPSSVQARAAGVVDSMRRAPLVGKVVNFVSPSTTAGAPQIMGDVASVPTPKPKPTPDRGMILGKMVAPPLRTSHKTHKSAKKHVALQKSGAKKAAAKKVASHKKKAR